MELSLQILHVLIRLTERVAPLSYFHFNGTDGRLDVGHVERFPGAKTGYSLVCWMHVNHFRDDETGLFCWRDHSGHVVFDLYFKTIEEANKSTRRCLCVQTQNLPLPCEHFFFDAYSFAEQVQ